MDNIKPGNSFTPSKAWREATPERWETWEEANRNHLITLYKVDWTGVETAVWTACGLVPNYLPYGVSTFKARCQKCLKAQAAHKAKEDKARGHSRDETGSPVLHGAV